VPIYREKKIRVLMLFCLLPPNRRDSLECRDDNIVLSKEVDAFSILAMEDIDFEFVWKEMASV
jgi:hypothetical protein